MKDYNNKFECFGTSPVRDSYFSEIKDEDLILRDLIESTASQVDISTDWRESEGLIFALTDDGIEFSKGFQKFREENGRKIMELLNETYAR